MENSQIISPDSNNSSPVTIVPTSSYSSSSMSSSEIVCIIFLLIGFFVPFFFPVGVIIMWFGTKWKVWIKLIISFISLIPFILLMCYLLIWSPIFLIDTDNTANIITSTSTPIPSRTPKLLPSITPTTTIAPTSFVTNVLEYKTTNGFSVKWSNQIDVYDECGKNSLGKYTPQETAFYEDTINSAIYVGPKYCKDKALTLAEIKSKPALTKFVYHYKSLSNNTQAIPYLNTQFSPNTVKTYGIVTKVASNIGFLDLYNYFVQTSDQQFGASFDGIFVPSKNLFIYHSPIQTDFSSLTKNTITSFSDSLYFEK